MSEYNKVDRALEMQVIDWLQWSEFPENIAKRPDDSDMAQLTLTLLSKRKKVFERLQKQNEIYKQALKKYNGLTIPKGGWGSTGLNFDIAGDALKQAKDLEK